MNAWHMLGPICWLYADNSRHISTYGRHDTQRVTKFLESWAHHEVCDEVTRGIHPLIPLNRRSSAQGHQNSDTHKQKEQRNRKEKRKLHPGEAQTKTEHGIREIRRQRCDTHGGSETEVTVTSKLHAHISLLFLLTEKRREGCIHWGHRQRPRTGRRCSGTGAGCRESPREAESEGGRRPECRG